MFVQRRGGLGAGRVDSGPGGTCGFCRGGSWELVGRIHVTIIQPLESSAFVEIVGLVLDMNHRRRGTGKLMGDAGEHWAQEKGVVKARVRSIVVRAATKLFYEKLGYSLGKTQSVFS